MDDQKVVVLHGFTSEETIQAMRAIKAAIPSASNAAFAVTTETNLGWKVNDLLEHIADEHRQLREMANSKKN